MPFATARRKGTRNEASPGAPPPEPGLVETATAAFRVQQDVVPFYQRDRLHDAYEPKIDEVAKALGKDRNAYKTESWWRYDPLHPYDYGKFWADVARLPPEARQRLGLTEQADFERQVTTRGEAGAIDRDVVARGNGVAAFAGGVAGAMTDPGAFLTLPFGGAMIAGARSAWVAVGIEAMAQGGLAIAQLPGSFDARRRAGEDPGMADAAQEAIFAAVGGALFKGLEIGARPGIDAAASAAGEAAAKVRAALPESLRKRVEGRAALSEPERDVLFADVIEAVRGGPDNMSEPELAAVAGLRRNGEIDAASPFVPDGAGAAAHAGRLGEAMGRLTDPLPPAPRFAPPPVAPRVAEDAGVRIVPAVSGTGPGLGGEGAEARFMAKVRAAESSGNDAAKAATSSATGRYQFTAGTWLRYYKKRFGSQGLSDGAILAKRGDGAMQDVLMRDLTADNARFLRSQGVGVDEGNLYLVHFLGPGGARKVFDAHDGAAIEKVLPGEVIRANGFLRGKSVGEVKAWARRKMGGAAAVPDTGGGRIVGAANDDGGAAIQQALAEARAREAAGAAERNAELDDDLADLFAEAPPPPTLRRDLFEDDASWQQAQDAVEGKPAAGTAEPALPPDLAAQGRAIGMSAETGEHISGFYEFDTPAGPIAWNPAEGIANGASPKRTEVTADDMRAWLRGEDEAPPGQTSRRGPDDAPDGGSTGARAAQDIPSPPRKRKGKVAGNPHVRDGDKVRFAQPVERLGGDGDTYTVESAGRKEAFFRNDRTGAAAPLPTWQIKRAIDSKALERTGPETAEAVELREAAMAEPVAARFDDPDGSEAQLQADGLEHDVRAALDAGELEGVAFAAPDGSEQSAAVLMGRLDEEAKALEAVRSCL